jgi:transcriptional regulator with XRE-family HTH domain
VDATNEDQQPPSLGHVVGENVQAIRKGLRLTQPQLANRLLQHGLPWKRSQIADLENQRRESADLGIVIALAAALDVSLDRLFEGDGDVMVTPRSEYGEYGACTTRAHLRAAFTGRPELVVHGSRAVRLALRGVMYKGQLIEADADITLAEKLDVEPWRVVEAAKQLWRSSLTAERDKRVAELGDLPLAERQAHQGHITRELTAIVTKWLLANGTAGEAP